MRALARKEVPTSLAALGPAASGCAGQVHVEDELADPAASEVVSEVLESTEVPTRWLRGRRAVMIQTG